MLCCLGTGFCVCGTGESLIIVGMVLDLSDNGKAVRVLRTLLVDIFGTTIANDSGRPG